jgi:formate hydrogenlyase subunit 3/multisubunit Na+/H+ antiporter MnhD subunit
MTLELPWLLLGMRLGLDGTTRVFLALTLVLWLAAALFAAGHLAADPRRGRFWLFFVAAFAGNLGLVFARDAVSFYAFFALMTFAAYGLVVHAGHAEARRAGRVYIVLAVLGEASLLAGLLLAASAAGGLEIERLRAAAAVSPHRDLIVALLGAGFGVKAGLLGLHVWLPLAHPVAPAPASAVLSGAMIKAGLLGWLQFLPLGEAALPDWGAAFAAIGLAAAFYGALAGLMQDDAKVVLAYSSISQMGLMTVAVGAALAAPGGADAAVAAAAFYALHHGLAKGALFLGTGIAPGARQRLLYAALLVPALSLAGLPFTSGAAAKHALKAAMPDWHVAGLLLSLAAIGTAVLMVRFAILAHRAPQARPARSRLALGAWLACIAASLAAAAWPMAGDAAGAPWDDLWPALAGAGLAGLGLWRGAPWRGWRIAPGDMMSLATALAPWARRTAAAASAALERAARRGFGTLRARLQVSARGARTLAAAVESRLGPAASLLLIALVALLAY